MWKNKERMCMFLTTLTIPNQPGAYKLWKGKNVIYVGHTQSLIDRHKEWVQKPDQNLCVYNIGWDFFEYQITLNVEEAKALELSWYEKYSPVCNLITPKEPLLKGILGVQK